MTREEAGQEPARWSNTTGMPGGAPVARAGRSRRPRARVIAYAALLCLLGLPSVGWCEPSDQSARPQVVGIVASADDNRVTAQIVTTARDLSPEAAVSRPGPRLLVVDLPGVTLRPGYLPPRLSPGSGVESVAVRELSREPPVTRVEFALSVPARGVHCTLHSAQQRGAVVVQLDMSGAGAASAEPPAPAPRPVRRLLPPLPVGRGASAPATIPPAAAARAAAPAPAPRASAPAPATGGAQNAAPTPAAQVPAGSPPALQPPPEWLRTAPALPYVALPEPASAARDHLQPGMAALAGAAGAGMAWVMSVLFRRLRRRRHRPEAVYLEPQEDTLRAVGRWSRSELWAAADSLAGIARGGSHPAAPGICDRLRSVFPADRLLAQARRGREADRIRAANLLSLHAEARVVEPLLRIAETAPAPVRRAAVTSLAYLLGEQSVPPILEGLGSASAARREIAMEVIGTAGTRGGTVLREALTDQDETVRIQAIEALTLLGTGEDADAIARLLWDEAESVRAAAARALGGFEPDSGAPRYLVPALGDSSQAVQKEAGVALARLGGRSLGDLIATLDRIAHDDPGFRASEQVLSALAARLEEPRPELEQALANPNQSFARDLAQALERAGRLDMWMPDVGGSNPDRRERMLGILHAVAAAGTVAPLERALDSPVPLVREACARLLGETAGAGTVTCLIPLLESPDESLRLSAMETLGRTASPEAVAALANALADPSAAVRCAAASGLAGPLSQFGAETWGEEAEGVLAAAEALVRALRDPSAAVRAAAAQSLGKTDLPGAASVLAETARHDPQSEVRTAAAAALGRLQPRTAVPAL